MLCALWLQSGLKKTRLCKIDKNRYLKLLTHYALVTIMTIARGNTNGKAERLNSA